MACSLFATGLVFSAMREASVAQECLALLTILSFIASFAVSIGPIGWLMISELYPTTLRGRAMSVPTAAHWLFNAIVSFAFMPVLELLGNGPTFIFFALFGAAGWFFCKIYAPETKGLTLEEIQESNARAGQLRSRPRSVLQP
jgi:hypothetical protein